MESNSPPLKNGARIRAVSEQSFKFIVSCEDESQIVLTWQTPVPQLRFGMRMGR
jgi:hypothetical protein